MFMYILFGYSNFISLTLCLLRKLPPSCRCLQLLRCLPSWFLPHWRFLQFLPMLQRLLLITALNDVCCCCCIVSVVAESAVAMLFFGTTIFSGGIVCWLLVGSRTIVNLVVEARAIRWFHCLREYNEKEKHKRALTWVLGTMYNF